MSSRPASAAIRALQPLQVATVQQAMLPRAPQGGDSSALALPANAPPPALLTMPQAQVQMLRRIRRVYVDKVIRSAEQVAYDERVDMKTRASAPVAALAVLLAYATCVVFWLTSLALTAAYAIKFSSTQAKRWLYACAFALGFLLVAMETLVCCLSTLLEFQQFQARRRAQDQKALHAHVDIKKRLKKQQASAGAAAIGVRAHRPEPPRAADAAGGGPRALMNG